VISLAVMMITSALAMVTLGILIASLAKTEAQADGLAIIIVIALAAVSGSMFPTISVPGLQTITPHYWAIQGFINVTARLQGVEGILRPAGVLLTMSAVFFTIGAIRFRFE
jgi:ABC-2 type transport system permease protein